MDKPPSDPDVRLIAAADTVIDLIRARGGKVTVHDLIRCTVDESDDSSDGLTREDLEEALEFLRKLGIVETAGPSVAT